MKLKIADLEAKLGKKIKRNFSVVGVDTASTTGLGFIKTTDKDIEINWSIVSFEANTIQELYVQMYEEFGKFLDNSVKLVVVEDVFLGPSPSVTIKLARFGGLAIAHAINNNVPFATIGPTSARSKLFKIDRVKYKGKPKEAVADYLKSIGIVIDENNAADGIVLALLGIIDGMDFRSQDEIKKATKKKRSPKKKTSKKRCRR